MSTPRTLSQFARDEKISLSVARKLWRQGRLNAQKSGNVVIVFDEYRPPKAIRGSLTKEQRKAWRKN